MSLDFCIEMLKSTLARECVLTDVAATTPYETDGLTAYRQVPPVVVLPRDTKEVQAVLRICHETGVPVVTRGAGTGLSGGALPLANGVLLVLTKMNQILKINQEGCTATVQPGVTNLAISQAVENLGLYYAPDPSSQIACSIGGNVAENSGGVHCLKYGLTLHNVLGLKVQTIEGDELVLGGDCYESPGLDLLPLIVGSEGMLGVVTEITVKLLPIPPHKEVVLGAFDDVEAAGTCVATIIAQGIVPAGLEMMDSLAIQAAEDFAHAGYPRDAETILLCEVDGTDEQVEAESTVVKTLMRELGATNIQSATATAERDRLWQGRKAAFPAVGRISPDYYCMDGTIPRRHLGRILGEIARLSKKHDLRVANVFHAGDGNLHPLILYDASDADQLHRAERLGVEILELCVKAGGTVTGEHGVGVEKLDPMCTQFSDAELEQFFRLKRAFDTSGLMNPGKAIPTLAHCGEIKGMHVHGGKLPFPELERF
ncbi:MAG: FAD-binding protein [Gammaproteobacteria bacterium]|nr:FAD-binding protein [Gammaproteobacteria bacterium]